MSADVNGDERIAASERDGHQHAASWMGLTETANGGEVGDPLSPALCPLTPLAFSWRWLLGTHQGGVRDQRQGHLDESVFRFALQQFTRCSVPFSDIATSDLWTPSI